MEKPCKILKQRGHMRSASLENANSFLSKNTLGLPTIHHAGFTGTLKSRCEHKVIRNKFGSHNNLDDYVTGKSKIKFQHLRSMFETKLDIDPSYAQKHQTVEFNENLSISESNTAQANYSSDATYQAKSLLRPIAFKPIPFELDYNISSRYYELCDRYGSTPSLAPVQGPNVKFGSTSDLRHGYNNYSSSYLTRRHCSRSLKINDSMESIRHTPDSDATSQNSITKCNNKFLPEQYDMTPSPSDSGISELEAALKDRDSELSYLRQTMEHNEKVIFKVHKDKEAYWEQEIKRLKVFYENQQREHLLKIKNLEQMLTLQSFQFKQNKLRLSEDSSLLKEQFVDLKSENELLRSESEGLKLTDLTMRDRISQLEEKISVMDKLISNLKDQLEESEWTICQKNGEIALLKTQVKEAKVELTLKEHELIHVKTEAQEKNISNYENNYSQIICESNTKAESSQLNQIIILKDQVILALANELAKLRKELSDLTIFHEYGEKPAGKFDRLKHKVENLSNAYAAKNKDESQNLYEVIKTAKLYDDIELGVIVNSLNTIRPQAVDDSNEKCMENEVVYGLKTFANLNQDNTSSLNNYNQKNLPDLMQDLSILPTTNQQEKNDSLRKELDEVRQVFEKEKRRWAEEKEKVLKYQRQLQVHYINMYQKMKDLETKSSKNKNNVNCTS